MEIINLNAEESETPARPSPNPLEITNLKPAVRDKNRVNVFLGGEFAFSLDISQVVDFRLKVGKILTEKEKRDLARASEFGKLYTSTLEWVLSRPHSIRETRDHLRQKLARRKLENKRREHNRERLKSDPALRARQADLKIPTRELNLFSDDDIEKVISRLLEKKYLNDEVFARWFVENRFLKKGVSRTRLRQELLKKGIDSSLADVVLESSSRDETSEIKKIIKKRGQKSTPEKLLRYLLSHGFSYDISRPLVDEFFSDDNGSDDSGEF